MPAYDEGDGDPSNRVQYLRTIVDFSLDETTQGIVEAHE